MDRRYQYMHTWHRQTWARRYATLLQRDTKGNCVLLVLGAAEEMACRWERKNQPGLAACCHRRICTGTGKQHVDSRTIHTNLRWHKRLAFGWIQVDTHGREIEEENSWQDRFSPSDRRCSHLWSFFLAMPPWVPPYCSLDTVKSGRSPDGRSPDSMIRRQCMHAFFLFFGDACIYTWSTCIIA